MKKLKLGKVVDINDIYNPLINKAEITATQFVEIMAIRNLKDTFKLVKKMSLLRDCTPTLAKHYSLGNSIFKTKKSPNYINFFNLLEWNISFYHQSKRNVYGQLIKIMVNEHYPADRYSLLCDRVVKNFLNMGKYGYVSFYSEENEGKFLYILLADRQFFYSSKEVKEFFRKDVFINPTTKQFCQSDDENATLLHKKGDFKCSKMSYFSNKCRKFNLPLFRFKPFMLDFKKFIRREHYKAQIYISKGFSFQLIQLYKIRKGVKYWLPLAVLENAKSFNNLLQLLNNQMNEVYALSTVKNKHKLFSKWFYEIVDSLANNELFIPSAYGPYGFRIFLHKQEVDVMSYFAKYIDFKINDLKNILL